MFLPDRAASHARLQQVTFFEIITVGRDSSVGIATSCGLDGLWIESQRGGEILRTGPGAHAASCRMGAGYFRGTKGPGSSVDHPPHPAPKLSYTSTPSLCLHGRLQGELHLRQVTKVRPAAEQSVSRTATLLPLDVTECDVVGSVVENNRVLQQ